MFDPAMTMSAQVSSIIKTANFYLTNIGRARRLLTVDATKLAVHTLVTSRLDYCNSLLIGISQKLKRRLNNVQRTAARLITKKRKFDSITPELITLHWLPIHQRIDFKVIVLMFKALHQQAPHYIIDILQVGAERRLLRSNSSCSPYFVVPRTSHITFADRAFSVYGPKLWNKLPNHIRDTTSLNTFKALLKAHLFQEAYHQ